MLLSGGKFARLCNTNFYVNRLDLPLCILVCDVTNFLFNKVIMQGLVMNVQLLLMTCQVNCLPLLRKVVELFVELFLLGI